MSSASRRWIWQLPHWPALHFDAQAVQPALAAARLAQGRLLGLASSLQRVDLAELQLSEWTQEAVATAQIEGEVPQVNSVRASVACRLGLPGGSAAARDARTEATLDVLRAAATQWQRPLTAAGLSARHAALFPHRAQRPDGHRHRWLAHAPRAHADRHPPPCPASACMAPRLRACHWHGVNSSQIVRPAIKRHAAAPVSRSLPGQTRLPPP